MARLKTKVEDPEILAEVERLRVYDRAEYQALIELAGRNELHGLGGLPLALAQAGSYIYRNGDSFVAYVHLYKLNRQNSGVTELFRKVEDSGLASEEQRCVWTTWRINVDALSDKARDLLHSFSLLDTSSVEELLVKHLDLQFMSDEVAFRKHVIEELVNGTSLLSREETYRGTVFRMHCLVREFVIADVKSDSVQYRAAVMRAICGFNQVVQTRLLEVGNSVDDCRSVWPKFLFMGDRLRTHVSQLAKIFCESGFSSSEGIQNVMVLFKFPIREPCRFLPCYEDYRDLCNSMIQILGDLFGGGKDNVHVASALHEYGLIELFSGQYKY